MCRNAKPSTEVGLLLAGDRGLVPVVTEVLGHLLLLAVGETSR